MPSHTVRQARRTGQSLFPPRRRVRNYLHICVHDVPLFPGCDSTLATTINGVAHQVVAAPAVHVMHTKVYAAEFGRLGAAANTQHFKKGKGSRAKYCCQVAKGRAAIWTRRYV
jgi:hypothetical protein